jgi:branched-chain amino acid transport system substrate-binding protein
MHMSRGTARRSRLVLSILALLTLALASCSTSESNTSGGSGGTSGGGTVRGVTDTEIKIGGLAALTSQQGGYPGVNEGAKARFERANREGGIHGRQINYVGVTDDGEESTKNLAGARKLVQQDGVFAIAPVVSQALLPQTTDFLESEQVPFVGWGFMPGFCTGAFGFGFNGCITPPGGAVANTSTADTLVQALKLGANDTVAIQGYDADGGRLGVNALKASFENAGVKVVYTDTSMPAVDTTDFTPFVQKIMTAADGKPPTAVAMITLFNNTVGLTGSLNAAGYKGATMNYLTYVPGLLASTPTVANAINGTYVNTQWLPQEFGGSAITQIQSDLKAINQPETIGFATSIGYWSADVLVQMLDAVGQDLTPARFNEVINGGWTYKPWGDPIGIGPVTFPQDRSQPSPCAALVQVNGTEYKPIVPMTCYRIIDVKQ